MILPRSTTQWVTRQKQIRSGSELQKSAGKPRVNLRRRSPVPRLVPPEVVRQTPSYGWAPAKHWAAWASLLKISLYRRKIFLSVEKKRSFRKGVVRNALGRPTLLIQAE